MNEADPPSAAQTKPPPVGFVSPNWVTPDPAGSDSAAPDSVIPGIEEADHAVQAIHRGDLDRAVERINHISDSPPIARAWKLFLSARVDFLRGRLDEAEAASHQAAEVFGLVEDHDAAGSQRARAAAYTLLGTVYRRRERLDEAASAHVAAHNLLQQHGSPEELWEVTTELGHDALIAGDFTDAQEWYQRAETAAAGATLDPVRLQALSSAHRCTALSRQEKHADAVAAARSALNHWRKFDAAAVAVAQAEFVLGSALLNHAESLLDVDPAESRVLSQQAVEHLSGALDSMRAFGNEALPDMNECDQRLEVARRLQSTLSRDA